ncbi:hypothetical protein BG005_004502 [Podila minutissima]|nr:hypothetical protein BG005_004502 [Podila minutissima]
MSKSVFDYPEICHGIVSLLCRQDLTACLRVSRAFHHAFSPYIWESVTIVQPFDLYFDALPDFGLPEWVVLAFKLENGLVTLAALRQLRTIDFEHPLLLRVHKEASFMDLADVQWMVVHWPRLGEIRGLMHIFNPGTPPEEPFVNEPGHVSRAGAVARAAPSTDPAAARQDARSAEIGHLECPARDHRIGGDFRELRRK